ncbi:hypothetical protein D9M70_613710 [compost metagenome]
MDVQFSHDWSCLATPYYEPGIGIFAAQFRFDAIDLGNPGKDRQRLRGAGELDDIDELAPGMGKAEGQPHGSDITLPPALGHGFIGLIPINLKHAGKRRQLPLDFASAAAFGKDIGNRRRRRTMPWAIVDRLRP